MYRKLFCPIMMAKKGKRKQPKVAGKYEKNSEHCEECLFPMGGGAEKVNMSKIQQEEF